MRQSAVEAIVIRNRFYKYSFHNLLIVILLLLSITVILSGFIVKYKMDHVKPFYFATAANGEILDLPLFSIPYVSDKDIVAWSSMVSRKLYEYNFASHRKSIQELRYYFTSKGYKNFLESLDTSNNLNAVKRKKLAAHTSFFADMPPVIKNKGLINGVYHWLVEVNFKTIYENNGKKLVQPVKLLLKIKRVSVLNVAEGIAIEQVIATDLSEKEILKMKKDLAKKGRVKK